MTITVPGASGRCPVSVASPVRIRSAVIEVAGTPASLNSPEALRAVATPITGCPAATHASRAAARAVVLPEPGSAATGTIRSPPVVRRRTISACSALR